MRTLVAALRYGLSRDEAYWAWEVGRWNIGAGFYRGFGLGFNVMSGEWCINVGPFAIGGVRVRSTERAE